MYRVYANKTKDLTSAGKFLCIFNGVCDDLYQKIAQS